MKKFYHATPLKNFYSILDKGLLVGCDGIVYLTETKEDAYKFISIRSFGEPILVIEVELDESKIEETFDHSYSFFQCRAFGYPETITCDQITNVWKFEK